MTGIRLVLNDKPVLDVLSRLALGLGDPKEALDAIGSYLVSATQLRFQAEMGPDGRKWQRLSPRTANKRIGRSKRGYDHILRVKGRLYESIVHEVDNDRVEVGTNLIYAAIQQLGGTVTIPEHDQNIHLSVGKGSRRFVRSSRKRKESRRVRIGAHTINIPARPYLGIDDDDRREIAQIIADFIDDKTTAE